jgi:hypothetical protein
MRLRLALLGGQTVALGLMMAFLVVPASSLFLNAYGADALPYAYLAVAVAGVAASAGMNRLQRRWSLFAVAASVLIVYTALVLVAWLLLAAAGAVWVTFPLLVLFPLAIPVVFVLIGSQAGRLLDVRQMKAHFPRVVAGFSVGFAVGGLSAAWLVGVFGGPEHLLAVDTVTGLGFLALVVTTAHRFPVELRSRPEPQTRREERIERRTRRSLLRNRMVVLIFGYQLLSAAVTQLLDFMVWERAAARYADAGDLAEFLGVFGAIINMASVTFVIVLAGWLLTRYGLRLGLAANPAGVLVLLLASTLVGYVAGPAGLAFFVLVCSQQITDIALTDGMTRTSVNATYQALPAAERFRAQATIEGAGVPLALGFVGALLLVHSALDLDIRSLVLVTLLLTVVWLVFAFRAYREYGVDLRAALTRREWDPVALRIDDEASREAVERLLASSDERDVRVGLDVLADAGDSSLYVRVAALLADPEPSRRLLGVQAADRSSLASLAPELTAIAVDSSMDPRLRGAAARVAGELGGAKAVEAQVPLLDDADANVRYGTAAGLVTSAGSTGQRARAVLSSGLRGGEPDLGAALDAVTAAPDPSFAPDLIELAKRPVPSSGLADALVAHADGLVAAVADRSGSRSISPRLVRALGGSRSAAAYRLLLDCVESADPELADAAASTLLASGQGVLGHEPVIRQMVDQTTRRLASTLDALDVVRDVPEAAHLTRALRDEITDAGERVVTLFGLLEHTTVLGRVVSQLGEADERDRAIALETLEVTIGRASAQQLVAAADPVLSPTDRRARLAALSTSIEREYSEVTDVLLDVIEDPDGTWGQPWLRACALHALALIDPHRAAAVAPHWVDDDDAVVAETARWAASMPATSLRRAPS